MTLITQTNGQSRGASESTLALPVPVCSECEGEDNYRFSCTCTWLHMCQYSFVPMMVCDIMYQAAEAEQQPGAETAAEA